MSKLNCVKELTEQPPAGLLQSMAMRYDHGIGIPLLFESEQEHELRKKRIFDLVEKIYQTAYQHNKESPLPPVAPDYLLTELVECYRKNHQFKVPVKSEEDKVREEEYMRSAMSQLYEEISGYGFYRYS